MKRNDLQTIMRRAWALYRLTQRMRAGVVRFAYEKADGTLRKAAGTLQGREFHNGILKPAPALAVSRKRAIFALLKNYIV